LEESHVIPSFVYKWIKGSSGNGFLRFGMEPNKRVQDGHKFYWLCGECEDKLNEWETLFAKEIFHPFNKGTKNHVNYGPWFLKFCVSVSWRVLNFFIEEADLDHFPTNLQQSARDAHSVWKEFLLDKLPHPGPHQQHFLPLDVIESFTHPGMPPNINRYILRTVDLDAVFGGNNAFVYSKMGRFLVIGFLNMKRPRDWQGTLVHVRNGIIMPQSYTIPAQFGDYFLSQAKRFAEVSSSISERQDEIINESFQRNIDRIANSETFTAMDHDVRLFGEKAFKG
jgi:hypothetical protein